MGKHPIRNFETKAEFLMSIQQSVSSFPNHMNNLARNFFAKTMAVNPSDRMTASQALNHAWIKGSGELNDINCMNINEYMNTWLK